MRRIVYSTLSGVSLLLIGLMLTTRLAVNKMESLPHSIFIIIPSIKPQKGEYAAILGHKTAYSHTAHFVKEIVGVEGDQVCWKDSELFINNKPIAYVKPCTKTGEPLTPLNSGPIPKGYVFVFAPHERSFDSRYAEFGLVPLSKIQGRAFGIGQR